ncbi:MAG: MarC family protein [Oceanococcus sp.]
MPEVREFFHSFTLMLVLLNPFLVIVYLVDVVDKLDRTQFRKVLLRAGLIAGIVFCVFAWLGDAAFNTLMQADFASFQIFGGVVFLLIGVQFVFQGPQAIEMLRGESRHLAGSIAMPVLIGPGTISASIIIGERHNAAVASLSILLAVAASLLVMLLLKALHDYVKPRNEPLVDRYIQIAGRITALFVGTIAVQMIMTGLSHWVAKF